MNQRTRRVSGPTSRPAEWFQVTYNLAAQKAHLALEAAQSSGLLDFLRDLTAGGRGMARLVELLDEARAHAEDLLEETIAALEADDRLRREPESGSKSEGLPPKMREFLENTVEPGTVVLFAGLMQAFPGDPLEENWRDDPITDRADLLKSLRDNVRFWPDTLIEYVTRSPRLSYRVRYNLACYHAGRVQESEAVRTEQAWEQFREALTSAPRIEAAALAAWAVRDPSLEPLRRAKVDEFSSLIALYRLPTAPARNVRAPGDQQPEPEDRGLATT